ncbi:MAG: exonuclease SbcCD subunit D C-terminal domain-containing protein [Spongiibacteraceae bacterium]
MKILHTSDWHLGRMLYGRKRYQEFEAFLVWLTQVIQQHDVEVLIVAGDIFDTTSPSNRAQQLYYRFLCNIAAAPSCRHVVIVAGNHDSPSFLNAPKELLKVLHVHVVGSACENPAEEVLVLRDEQGEPELIVAAVPYLRDRDIRLAEAGESIDDKERKLLEGIRQHYAAVAATAEQQRKALNVDIPIVATGHLFTAGGQTIDGDGVRDLYVGSLAHVNASMFPQAFDYVALGHLHIPQAVNAVETIRYSGSPIAMGFGEAKQQKTVCLVKFDVESNATAVTVEQLHVPVFQKLERIKGDWDHIAREFLALSATQSDAWVEVVYDGKELIGDLRQRLDAAIADSDIEILRVKNTRVIERVLGQVHIEEQLDDLDVNDVFTRCLNAHDIPELQRSELMASYQQTLTSLYDDDKHEE